MILRLVVAAGVLTLAASSAYANFLHVQALGISIIGLVIGAEIFKFAAPIAMARHAEDSRTPAWLATFVIWLLVVAFSFTNTFGNALARHAKEQARIEHARDSATRPEHVVLRDIAAIRCKKGGCTDKQVNERKALDAELKATRARPQTGEVQARGDPIREGFVTIAGVLGIELAPERVFVFVTLIWTLLAEIGSALGGLAIPRGKQR